MKSNSCQTSEKIRFCISLETKSNVPPVRLKTNTKMLPQDALVQNQNINDSQNVPTKSLPTETTCGAWGRQ